MKKDLLCRLAVAGDYPTVKTAHEKLSLWRSVAYYDGFRLVHPEAKTKISHSLNAAYATGRSVNGEIISHRRRDWLDAR